MSLCLATRCFFWMAARRCRPTAVFRLAVGTYIHTKYMLPGPFSQSGRLSLPFQAKALTGLGWAGQGRNESPHPHSRIASSSSCCCNGRSELEEPGLDPCMRSLHSLTGFPESPSPDPSRMHVIALSRLLRVLVGSDWVEAVVSSRSLYELLRTDYTRAIQTSTER